MEAGNCPCIKLVKVLLKKIQNDLFKVLYVPWITAYPGDVPVTFADTTPLEEDFGFRPSTPLRDGLRAFAQWYAKYYGTCEK